MNIKTLISTIAVTTTLMTSSAFASGLDVSQAWARASAGAAQAGGAFMAVTNTNEHDHMLLSASSDVAKRVELHNHTMENGMMKMRKVEGINLPAGGTIMLQPGGYHVMLMGLHAPLKEGSTFPVTLTFDNGKDVTVDVVVKATTAMNSGMGMGHGAHGAHGMGKKAADCAAQAAKGDCPIQGDMNNMGAGHGHGH